MTGWSHSRKPPLNRFQAVPNKQGNKHLSDNLRTCLLATHIFTSHHDYTTLTSILLCLVGRGGDVATATSPVDVDVLADRVLLVGTLRLDAEGVGTEVITLSLQEVGRQVLGAVTVEP